LSAEFITPEGQKAWRVQQEQRVEEVLKGQKERDDRIQKLNSSIGSLSKDVAKLIESQIQKDQKIVSLEKKQKALASQLKRDRTTGDSVLPSASGRLVVVNNKIPPPKVVTNEASQSISKVHAWLPDGSVATGVLVTGVDAMADVKDPYPVQIVLQGDAVGPNNLSAPLKGCIVIGEAVGNAVTSRAMIRGFRLSCTRADGYTFSKTVAAYVVDGEDLKGRFGIAGQLHDKQAEVLTRSLFSNFLAATGEAIAQSQVSTTRNLETGYTNSIVDGNTLMYGAAKGFGETAKEFASTQKEYARSLKPYVSVNSGHRVYVFFQVGTDLGDYVTHANNAAYWENY
jgi:hypothetical protein